MSFNVYARWCFEIPYYTKGQKKAIIEKINLEQLTTRLEVFPADSNTSLEDVPNRHTVVGDIIGKLVLDSNGTTEIRADFDDVVEELWHRLQYENSTTMTGYVVTDNSEGAYYRGDFTEDGKLDYEDVRQFADYKVDDLRKLLKIADMLESEQDGLSKLLKVAEVLKEDEEYKEDEEEDEQP